MSGVHREVAGHGHGVRGGRGTRAGRRPVLTVKIVQPVAGAVLGFCCARRPAAPTIRDRAGTQGERGEDLPVPSGRGQLVASTLA